jgi:murein DD-endopeptidase MepM/ murein hydrolase activator NlpD
MPIFNPQMAYRKLNMHRLVLALVPTLAVIACSQAAPTEPAVAPKPDIALPRQSTVVRGVVPRNATLDAMLRDHGVAGDAVQAVISAARSAFDPRRLKSLQPFALERTLDGALALFEYEIDADWFLRVVPEDGGCDARERDQDDPDRCRTLRAEVLPIPKTLQHGAVAGRIDAESPSLFESIEAVGERPELAIDLAGIFAGEIDFNTELQPGDGYSVAFERFVREGRPVSYGVITAAEFQNEGRVLRAIRFTPPGGKPGYYDERGRSLRRFFLRSPLKFEPRVTSGFSARRMHPVLHTARAHRGVDYAAPQGAEVIAIASGTVLSATYDGTNGRMVRLRHSSGYESYYLHLSAFGSGIRTGAQVAQGQVVGRVGATGLATGPHLHYGLRKNGVFVNPLREHRNLPPGEPVPMEAIDAFHAERDRALAELGGAPRTPAVAVASQ